MLTLTEINALTSSHDGSVYSDLYKDVYGVRCCGETFESLEAFYRAMEVLSDKLDEQLADEQKRQAVDWENFEIRLGNVMQRLGLTPREAVLVIADQEGFDAKEIDNYGFEILEDALELKYSSILNYLEMVEG